MTMPLYEALTKNMIAPATLEWDGNTNSIYVCTKCGTPINYYHGQYHFGCECFADEVSN